MSIDTGESVVKPIAFTIGLSLCLLFPGFGARAKPAATPGKAAQRFDPSSLGPIEKQKSVQDAHFERIEVYERKRDYDKAASIIQDILDAHPSDPAVQIVGNYRLYAVLGSAGVLKRSPLEKKDYLERALSALKRAERVAKSESGTLSKDEVEPILTAKLPVALASLYNFLGYATTEAGVAAAPMLVLESGKSTVPGPRGAEKLQKRKSLEAQGLKYQQKAVTIAREVMKRDPNSPAAQYAAKIMLGALDVIYNGRNPLDYRKKLADLVSEFQGTRCEEAMRVAQCRFTLQWMVWNEAAFRRERQALLQRCGKTTDYDSLVSEWRSILKRMQEDDRKADKEASPSVSTPSLKKPVTGVSSGASGAAGENGGPRRPSP